MKFVKGKKLLIIGGCGGIGRQLATEALAAGLRVAVFDLKTSAEQQAPKAEVLFFAANAKNKSELQQAFSQLYSVWKGIDYLVNLVGYISAFGPTETIEEVGWNDMLDGNLKSTFLACQIAIPFLQPGGAIVNMSSGLAFFSREGYAPYSSAKAGIIALTKTLARELAPDIRVNVVAPGAVKTAFLSGGLAAGGSADTKATRVDIDAY